MNEARQPSETVPNFSPVLLSEFGEGDELDQVLLVKSAERREKANGEPFLKLSLGDRSGALAAMVWDDVDTHSELCRPGAPSHGISPTKTVARQTRSTTASARSCASTAFARPTRAATTSRS